MTEKYVPSPEAVEQGLYVAYAALSTMAVVPIYFGSFGSLKKWKVNHQLATQSAYQGRSDHLSQLVWEIYNQLTPLLPGPLLTEPQGQGKKEDG